MRLCKINGIYSRECITQFSLDHFAMLLPLWSINPNITNKFVILHLRRKIAQTPTYLKVGQSPKPQQKLPPIHQKHTTNSPLSL